eukprot:Selendium_serpulae@DN6360_c0_g2_i8.p2
MMQVTTPTMAMAATEVDRQMDRKRNGLEADGQPSCQTSEYDNMSSPECFADDTPSSRVTGAAMEVDVATSTSHHHSPMCYMPLATSPPMGVGPPMQLNKGAVV